MGDLDSNISLASSVSSKTKVRGRFHYVREMSM